MNVGCMNMNNKSKWNEKMQTQFLQKISDLLDQGYSLNEAIMFTKLHLPMKMKQDIEECVKKLAEGHSFRSVLASLGFRKSVLSYLYFAEKHGDIKFALKESSRMLEKKRVHIEKAKQVLRYPIFLILLMVIIVYAIQSVIGPQFVQMYESMNITTSFFLMMLLSIFDLLKILMVTVTFFFLLLIPFYYVFFRKYSPTKQQHILLQIPFIRKGLTLYNSYYFSSQISYLLKGGLSIFESLNLFCEQNILPFYQEEAKWLINELKKGERLDEILVRRPFFERELAAVVHHGQAIGKLDRELYTYSQMLIDRLENKMIKWISLIQPIIFLTIGILVLAVYLSIILPMYQIMEKV